MLERLYAAVRPLLFSLDPESAHDLTLAALGLAGRSGLLRPAPLAPELSREVMGLHFPNPVGLAAGLDKNGAAIDGLAGLGFGFIEVGTVTPLAQPGNPKPRMFRLTPASAVINRMGFNNDGLERFLDNVKRARTRTIIGLNIGKNAATPNESALDDYLTGLRAVYPHASYVTINISSPNTRGLRDLQAGDALDRLLEALKAEQSGLSRQFQRYVPLAVKIAPDLSEEELRDIAARLQRHGIDAVIATNTTVRREGVDGLPHAAEAGGLSGAPLTQRSTEVIACLAAELGQSLPIIGVGGILTGADAVAKLRAGARLVQLYTGLIYRGPALVGETLAAIRSAAL